MRQVLRDAMRLAALAMLAGACTVEDVKDTRAADSAAAATSKNPPPTSGNASGPVAAQATSSSGALASGNAAPPTSTDSGAMAGAAGAPSTGAQNNLSPDSVDVGRRGKGALVPQSRMRLEVDLAAKQLTAFDGDQQIATYRIATGSPQWPTQTGQWEVKQVVWNPEWIPPKEEQWAEDKNRSEERR